MDQITPDAPGPEPSAAAPRVSFRPPADYYTSSSEPRPLFAPWVPFGCGIAAIILLIVVFAAGFATSRGGLGEVFDLMFSSIQSESEKMFTKDVTQAERAEFAAQMKTMREGVRQNRVHIDRLQPLLRSFREVSDDQRITPAEADQLIKELREVNRTAKP